MSLTCKVNNIEIELKYSDNIEENIISINSKKELFFDVYECVINNEKIILEKVGESDLGPKVLLEVNIDGKKYSAEAVLVDNDSNYVELNKENIYFIRKIPDEDKSPSEIMQDELEPIINEEEKSDNIEVNYENIIEHHVNNKLVFLHELEEQFEEKIVSLKDDISNKLDLFFEKLEDKKKIIIDDKLENISNELNNKFTVLQTELHSVEDFSKKNIDNILEKKINEIDSSVNLFLEGITKEYKNKIISSDKKITHNFLELNSIKDKLKENSNVIDKKFEDLNLLKEKLLEQDELVLKNQELKKFINTEFKNIDSKFKNLSEEENKKYNELLAAVSNKDIVEYKTILKEKIQDVELTNIKEALQEDITNALQGDIVSLKRYVEMSSGGGSTAKQFAAGGTMDGNLDVNGNILSGGVNLTDVFNTDTSINLQDVTNNGNTTTNLISSNNTIIADTILATSILSSTQLDIGFELSGFNVTGDLSASGGLSANNINVSGDILPSETTTFNIGSSALRFKDIFLAGSTIDLSGTKISTDSEGDIEFRDKNNLPKRIKASEIVLESSNDPDNDIVFKVNEGGNPEFEKRRRSNPNIIEPSTTISDIVSAVQVRVRGNVGIGTSPIIPPNKPLTVVGEISATDNISTGSNLQLGGNIVDTDANEIITIADNDITFAGKHIRSGFDVGVRSQRGCVKGIAQSNSSSSKFGIFNCSIEAITVDTVGKVGIGTTSPNNQLTVSGSISSTGLATVSALKINSDGTSSSDQSPFTFEVSADRKNSTTTALYIYPKDSTNHRVFFQNPAQDRNVYAVNFSGLTQIEDTPAFNNLTAKSTNKNGDNFGLGTIAGTGVRRNGTTDDFDLFVSHNSNIPDFVFHSLTGGFFSSDAQLAGTNEIMRLTNEGKLGIGNRTPTHAFDIKDVFSADGTMRARVERTTNGQVSYDLKNTVTEFRQLVDGNAAYKIFDSENSATRFTIDSAGKVGIGTTSPNEKLTVAGSISSTDTVASLSGHFTDSVGIGTTSPGVALHVVGDLQVDDTDGSPTLTYDSSSNQLNTAGATFEINKSNGVDVAIGNDDFYVDMSTSSVGIGTT